MIKGVEVACGIFDLSEVPHFAGAVVGGSGEDRRAAEEGCVGGGVQARSGGVDINAANLLLVNLQRR